MKGLNRMKILKHGKTLKIIICPKCECEFEYREIDVKKTPYKYMGNTYVNRIIECPECEFKIKEEK